MILIASGAYLGPEFTSELGLLPPAFLPVGNARLFTLQARELAGFGRPMLLSLPESYRVSPEDRRAMDQAGLAVVRVPDGLTLAASILHALCVCPYAGPDTGPNTGKDLRILHGDTLVLSPPRGLDLFGVGRTAAHTCWARHEPGPDGAVRIREGLGRQGGGEVLSGFFAFSDRAGFMRSLALSQGSFIEALNDYARRIGLTPDSSGRWLDFGHLHSYYQSKALMTTQRDFNSLDIGRASVVKTSANLAKMDAEASWFESLPPTLALNAPRFVGRRQGGYELEYLYLSTLGELLVFGELPEAVWTGIMGACSRFLAACRAVPAPEGTPGPGLDMFLPKTLERLERFAGQAGLSLDQPWTVNGKSLPGLERVARESAGAISPPGRRDHCLVHGDLCFSNILYDFRRQDILVIDPRGLDASGGATPWGDIRYDVAKLYHSALGGYDFIKAGACRFERTGEGDLSLELPRDERARCAGYAFLSEVMPGSGLGVEEVMAMNVHLFLSMLPLHADRPDHQWALLANALRLFASMDRAGRAGGGQPVDAGRLAA